MATDERAPDLSALPIESLLRRRADAAAVIVAIDAALAQRGVRVVAQLPGRLRAKAGAILAVLATGEKTTKAIKATVPGGSHALDQLLYHLTKAGEIERVARGRYRLAQSARGQA
jgi:hypothetical protein